MIIEKKFRDDFYHRINVVPINLPTLQTRSEDIPLLIKYFKKNVNLKNIKKNDIIYWKGHVAVVLSKKN